jgi:membrane fusion protein, multidrug efflux system
MNPLFFSLSLSRRSFPDGRRDLKGVLARLSLCSLLLCPFFSPLLSTAQAQSPKVPVKPASGPPSTLTSPAASLPTGSASGAGQATATPTADPGVRVLLTPELETVMLAQMVGRITSLDASLGSRVKAGQVVVRLDCSENAAKLKMSEADLASARETYNNKARLKGLDAAGDVEVSLAAAQVDRANGQIEMTKAQIQGCTVIAPFAGSVSKLHVKPHQGVNLGQQLFELVGDGAPKLRLNVPSKWLRSLKAPRFN